MAWLRAAWTVGLVVGIASGVEAQTPFGRPRAEVSIRATPLAAPERASLGGGTGLIWNLDTNTSIDLSIDFLQRPGREAYSTRYHGTRALLQLKRTLYAAGPSRFFATIGGGAGYIYTDFSGYSYVSAGRTVTIPASLSRRGAGSFAVGVGADRRLGSRLTLDVQAQFLLGTYEPALRTVVGVIVPVGRYAPAQSRAAVLPSALTHVDVGRTAWVTMADGRTWTGKIAELSMSAITIRSESSIASLPVADIRRIEAPDGILDGTARGALIGAATGIPLFIIGLGEEEPAYAVMYGFLWSGIGAGVGAAIGAISDSFHEGRQVVYDAGRSPALTMTPIVVRRGGGIGATIRW